MYVEHDKTLVWNMLTPCILCTTTM